MAEGDEAQQEQQPAKKKSKLPMIMGLLVVVFLAVAGGIFFMLQSPSEDPLSGANQGSGQKVEIAYRYPEEEPLKVITNLRGGGSIIQAEVFLEMNVEKETPKNKAEKNRKKELIAELEGKRPNLREAVMEIFNTTSLESLESSSARQGVKERIKNRINTFLVNGEVQDMVIMHVIQPFS
jgi:flagellar basal body-associated protein FliL